MSIELKILLTILTCIVPTMILGTFTVQYPRVQRFLFGLIGAYGIGIVALAIHTIWK